MHYRTYYAMKRRLGGEKMSIREALSMRNYFPCPGCLSHNVDPRRQGILFDHYVERPQKSHAVYWRSHPTEYKALLKQVHRSSVSDPS
jgi:hypothetical protein